MEPPESSTGVGRVDRQSRAAHWRAGLHCTQRQALAVPSHLCRDKVTYSQLDLGFLVPGAYYLTGALHAPGVTATVTSSMAGKG